MKPINMTLFITALLILPACEYKELENIEDQGRFRCQVLFNYQNIDSIPATMRVAFYPIDHETYSNMTKGYITFDIPATGGNVSLPVGNYKVVAWNSDTEHVTVTDNDNPYDLAANAVQYSPADILPTRSVEQDVAKLIDSIYKGQSLYTFPDYMIHATGQVSVFSNAENQVTLTPDSMVSHVQLNIHGIQGLPYVSDMQGTIDGTMSTRFIAFDKLSQNPAVTLFSPTYNEETVTASFYVFDFEPGKTNFKIILFCWMSDKKIYLTLNIDEDNASITREENGNIIINIDISVDIRNFIGNNEGGFNISLDDWDDHIIDVDIQF